MSYFDNVSEEDNCMFKYLREKRVDPQDQITTLKRWVKEIENIETARDYENLKQDIVTNSKERHERGVMFGCLKLVERNWPKAKKSQDCTG